MNLLYIIGISIGLSMDALAVSVSNGFLIKNLKIRHALRLAFAFGLFQAMMPVIGWMGGKFLLEWISSFDHWIAFGLLSVIGGKMIFESRNLDKENDKQLKFSTLIVLAVATSIDALAVGLSFGVLRTPLLFPVLIIGGVTFILCFAGVYIGNKIGHWFENKLELFGGILLFLIGIKILLDHLVFNS
ncbi:MAG TPA: hypothetical protein DHW82_11465 [Spirochaetia bacterium]|nr:MAG: hypothetical protein A2Y41_10085 [Spirochaetes bacterium GWB1_36_13]HCL57610.1 hypothetical protein [Spirochaetia bacterium]